MFKTIVFSLFLFGYSSQVFACGSHRIWDYEEGWRVSYSNESAKVRIHENSKVKIYRKNPKKEKLYLGYMLIFYHHPNRTFYKKKGKISNVVTEKKGVFTYGKSVVARLKGDVITFGKEKLIIKKNFRKGNTFPWYYLEVFRGKKKIAYAKGDGEGSVGISPKMFINKVVFYLIWKKYFMKKMLIVKRKKRRKK